MQYKNDRYSNDYNEICFSLDFYLSLFKETIYSFNILLLEYGLNGGFIEKKITAYLKIFLKNHYSFKY